MKKLGDGLLLGLQQGRDGRGDGEARQRRPPARLRRSSSDGGVDLVRRGGSLLHGLVGGESKEEESVLWGREATGRAGPLDEVEVGS